MSPRFGKFAKLLVETFAGTWTWTDMDTDTDKCVNVVQAKAVCTLLDFYYFS